MVSRNSDRKSILFVCCGNRERSVIAERLLQQRLKDNHPQLADKAEIRSAGIFPRAYLKYAEEKGITFEYPLFGKNPNIYAIQYLAKKGIDVSSYRSRELTPDMVREADLILAIDRRIRNEILHFYPEASGSVFTFKEFAFGATQPDLDIGDSMKLPDIDKKTGTWVWPEDYPRRYITEIEECLSSSMGKLVEYIQEK